MGFVERVDPELRDVLELLPRSSLDFSQGLDVVRKMYDAAREQAAAVAPEVPGVAARNTTIPGYVEDDDDVAVRLYEPQDRPTPSGAIYWIHGGGMVLGAFDDNDFVCKRYAERAQCLLVSVEYRLAPEFPYPAPLEDCYAGLRWLWRNAADLGVDQQHIVVVGGSAGGGLAAGTCLMARDLGEVTPRGQLLMYPMIDDRDGNPSHHEVTDTRVWNHAANQYGWAAYLGELSGRDDVPIYAAPARASVDELRGLPPAVIDVGELDPFRDEDIAYAQKLLQAGVPCELLVTPGAFHASESYKPSASSSRRINRFRAEAVARLLAQPA